MKDGQRPLASLLGREPCPKFSRTTLSLKQDKTKKQNYAPVSEPMKMTSYGQINILIRSILQEHSRRVESGGKRFEKEQVFLFNSTNFIEWQSGEMLKTRTRTSSSFYRSQEEFIGKGDRLF